MSVVAIIVVLMTISLPNFTGQLEKSRRAVDLSNARNMKSILMLVMWQMDIVSPIIQMAGRTVSLQRQ